ncbi:MAG: acetyl-CoA carboxylase biotin carboxylase subunit [Elusimicrobiota bacterium]|jgi:acetyl-CoA carboxylase biotin carboxylase subunit|nr:acetyl-CoA carboxylase biotin carboxylase subunit [Elusimicrobiota bacterium]
MTKPANKTAAAKKFNKILIANRGEIALRIIRTLREMDIKSVAVYSQADKFSAHVKAADEAVCIGPAFSKDSYLNIDAVVAAAALTGADAVHPGYGFLSENARFAQAVTDAGMVFIGPKPEAILKLGEKSRARELAIKSKVPVIAGSNGVVEKNHLKAARKIGFPLMIKATMGGGGRGMRPAMSEADFPKALDTAMAEAQAAFGDGRVYFERLVLNPRHIEVQLAADNYGNVLAFAERDCSIQRKNQKLIEESPSPFVDQKTREALCDAAVRLARAAGYSGVGTVEFLMDEKRNFYFMEVNTRLQVEHPVTELVSGLDLVKMQVEIAQGRRLSITQRRARQINCHAMEHRINAEDYTKNFMPCPATVAEWIPSGGIGVRVDTHIYPGYTIPSFYDSLIAKLIVWAPTRAEALKRSARALGEFTVRGVDTTIPFHKLILADTDFAAGNMNTGLVERILKNHESKK